MQGSESEELNNGQSADSVKTCADCGTTKTPLWRGGPTGPKEEEKGTFGCEQRINQGRQEIEEQHKEQSQGYIGEFTEEEATVSGERGGGAEIHGGEAEEEAGRGRASCCALDVSFL
ncbi:GATA transcription factor 17 [Actinidia rufa]|uniref:GATA transcription factor 17 n=1 Tax=Actinidia rufa TaxID=165716 RepID=A0A7J0GE26_9ERIC|nr:GATA transcription factor 17 [Actinidia rufa]